MSLNQKYTWKRFLNEHPEHREKKMKRTSPEGKKAFEAAYKKFIKDYLAQRQQQLETVQKNITACRDELVTTVKNFQKAKSFAKARFYQKKIGIKDASIARLKNQQERDKQTAKKV